MLLCYAVLTGWDLPFREIAGPDEPRYAAAARTMIRGGSLIVPEFNGKTRLAKPILFYWMLAAAGWLGQSVGLDLTVALHLVPLAMGALAVLGTFVLAQRLYGHMTGCIAAGLLMTSLEFQRVARELVIDMTLTACIVWAWVFFLCALNRIERGAPARVPLLAFFTILGFASLAKGPFLVALFAVIPMLYFLRTTGRLSALRRCGLAWGIPWSLGLGLSWYAVVFLQGHDGLAFFVRENLQRLIGQADHRRPVPFLFYLEVIWENFAPASLLIPYAVVYWWRSPEDPDRPHRSLLGSAFLIPVVILSLAISKRSLYLLPLYPFLAIGLARASQQGLATMRVNAVKLLSATGAFAAVACTVVTAHGTGFLRERGTRAAFFDAIRNSVGDRTLVMFGESANEAVWYLDGSPHVERLAHTQIRSAFLDQPGVVLLVSEKVLAREPALRKSLSVILTRQLRGKTWTLATSAVSNGITPSPQSIPIE